MKYFLLLVLSTIAVVAQESNIVQIPQDVELITPRTVDIFSNNLQDSVLQLLFTLDEEKSVSYLRDLTYNLPNNFTLQDLIDLFNIETLDLNSTISMLDSFNLTEHIFTVDALQKMLNISNVSFNQFYDFIKRDVTGEDLNKVLMKLNLLDSYFLIALVNNYPDVFDVLREVNFSRNNFDEAFSLVNSSTDKFYKNVLNFALEHLSNTTLFNLQDSLNFTVNKMFFDNVWNYFNVTVRSVYNVEKLNNILKNIVDDLHQNVSLAVLTKSNEITIPKKMFDNFDFPKMVVFNAESFGNPIKLYKNITLSGVDDKFAYFHVANNMTKPIKVAKELPEKFEKCFYVTIENENLTKIDVKYVNVTKNYLAVTNLSNVYNLGNPLFCNETLLGLASYVDKENNSYVGFDYFYINQKMITNLSSIVKVDQNMLFILLVVYFKFF